MNEYKLPSAKEARFRNKAYQVPIVYNSVSLSESQKQLGVGFKYHVATYGCQANVRDGEVISGILENMGYTFTGELKDADIIILNTCAIRENAEKRILGTIGYLKSFKRLNPNMVIGLCGCIPQQEQMVKMIIEKYPVVELIFGTHNITALPNLLENVINTKKRKVEVFSTLGSIYEDLPSVRQFKHKAFVNIMDGCDKFCTYCIVPYTRGQQRSRKLEDILNEVNSLKDKGYKEITLLGQNVNAYGKDLSEGYTFGDLLEKVSDTGFKRIRFTTSHPWDFDDKMIDIVASRKNIMPFIHLPLQSGNDDILKLMNRRYTAKEYKELFDKIKTKIKDVAISTDIIVGFPNETEEQFLDTLEMVEYCKYDNAYSFVFSAREATPAARMEDSISIEEKKKRLQRLNERLGYYSKLNNKKWEGKIVEVLVDGYSKTNPNIMSGYTPQQKLVNFSYDKAEIGDIIYVKITQGMKNSLNGIQVHFEKEEYE
ncbi:MAG: tRNA (N6-isopentenyl adenosine(37)-C2)-methylthiotransferase MiaB [Erysipelotrichia bacterium]|jgi:tRNA-2-methylthio-N6-dimethylallyladenosine synthase|nr:tRNA (N6-isopentenyl adenosine(37)-C2)-methylthiotransferase MiaB [Erysipelotrichia bacterium]